jgi:protein Shroom
MALKHKRDGICSKLEDAKQLKDGIDNRGHQVATFLRAYLSPDQFADYEFFVKMKCKLNMQQAEVADKLALGEEQLEALQRSLAGGCSTA